MKLIMVVFAAAGAVAMSSSAFANEAMAKKYNCLACHAIDKKVIGPAYKDVAKKFKGQPGAEAQLIERVKKGSSGVWGSIPMPPNTAVPDADVKKLVEWILSL